MVHEVLELCCFEWFQNNAREEVQRKNGFRAVLFRMVPKRQACIKTVISSFRAVLFRMVPKLIPQSVADWLGFRAVLFRMVPKLS